MARTWGAVLVLVLQGCGGYGPVYFPPAAHAPLFSRAGEFKALMMFSLLGADAQVGYSPVEPIGCVAGLSYVRPQEVDTGDAGGAVASTLGEGGCGAYLTFGHLRLEGIITLGGGASRGEEVGDIEVYRRGRFFLGSFTANVAFGSTYFDGGLSTRVSYLRYDYDRDSHYYGEEGTRLDKHAVGSAAAQPTLFLRVGPGPVKVEVQAGGTTVWSDEIDFFYWQAGVGLRGTFELLPTGE